MKIELTIKTTYLPGWGSWEGIRELIQNGVDSATEFSAPLTVRHREAVNTGLPADPGGGTLVIENEGVTLPHEALLLGHTTKSERSDLIGKFGEGLKLGVLALVRAGHKVKIRSGSEVWTPSIVRSEKFDADVLAFDIQGGRKDEKRVQIEVGGISRQDWENLKPRFLFLTKLRDEQVVGTYYGKLILHPDYIGRVYVKGIFVNHDSRLRFGYDLSDAEIDRDRKMVDPSSLRWRLASLWRNALGARPDLVNEFMTLLDAQAPDVEGMDSYSATQLPEEIRKTVAETFKQRHGSDALPVETLAQSADIEHLGKVGIVVPPALRMVLESTLGTAEQNAAKLRESPETFYGWHQLSENERGNLKDAIALVTEHEPVALDIVDVCTFRGGEKFLGLYRDGRVLLNKDILSDRNETLATLVHEVAHKAGGGDGDHSHVANLERIWKGIVAKLRNP